MDAIERDDIVAIMSSLLQANWKLDRILAALEEDGEEEEEADG